MVRTVSTNARNGVGWAFMELFLDRPSSNFNARLFELEQHHKNDMVVPKIKKKMLILLITAIFKKTLGASPKLEEKRSDMFHRDLIKFNYI